MGDNRGQALHPQGFQEVEAKLRAPHVSVLGAIAQVTSLGPYRLRRRRTARLHTIYLDTPGFTLARHGVGLRLRRTGMRWEASAKWNGRRDGVIRVRPELTVRLARPPSFPFALPPGPLTDQLSELVAGQGLAPVLISDVRRQRFAVVAATQAKTVAFAELALDQVRLSAPGARRAAATYCEVEIELETGGTVQDLSAFAGLLRERFALTPSDGGKLHRGLTLLYGPGLIGSERAGQRPATRKRASPPTTQQ